jgi:hypothetical protein
MPIKIKYKKGLAKYNYKLTKSSSAHTLTKNFLQQVIIGGK